MVKPVVISMEDNMAAKVIAGIFGFILSLIISILVMIYGWGLQPKNWAWIILGGCIIRIIIEVMTELAKKDLKR